MGCWPPARYDGTESAAPLPPRPHLLAAVLRRGIGAPAATVDAGRSNRAWREIELYNIKLHTHTWPV